MTYTVLGINITAPLDQQPSALYSALHSSPVKRRVLKLMIIRQRIEALKLDRDACPDSHFSNVLHYYTDDTYIIFYIDLGTFIQQHPNDLCMSILCCFMQCSHTMLRQYLKQCQFEQVVIINIITVLSEINKIINSLAIFSLVVTCNCGNSPGIPTLHILLMAIGNLNGSDMRLQTNTNFWLHISVKCIFKIMQKNDISPLLQSLLQCRY